MNNYSKKTGMTRDAEKAMTKTGLNKDGHNNDAYEINADGTAIATVHGQNNENRLRKGINETMLRMTQSYSDIMGEKIPFDKNEINKQNKKRVETAVEYNKIRSNR